MQPEVELYKHAHQQQKKYQTYATLQCLFAVGSVIGGLALLCYAASCSNQNDLPIYWQVSSSIDNATSGILKASQPPPHLFWQQFTDSLGAHNLTLSKLSKHQNALYKNIASYHNGHCDSTDFDFGTTNSTAFTLVQNILFAAGAGLLNQNSVAVICAVVGIFMIGISCALCTERKKNSEYADSWQRQAGLYQNQLAIPLLIDVENPVADINGVEMAPLTASAP